MTHSTLKKQIDSLKHLLILFQKAQSVSQKMVHLDRLPDVQAFVPFASQVAERFDLEEKDLFLLKSLAAIGQTEVVFGQESPHSLDEDSFANFIKMLQQLESTYNIIGGIIGYHLSVLELILAKQSGEELGDTKSSYDKPEGIDLSKEADQTRRAVRWGIESVGKIGEIYPIGGAGDRLSLKDEKTGELLPAAQLLFCGRTLLEGIIRDVQGREYLSYRLLRKQWMTPIAMMTSHEKNNHARVLLICEKKGWFGRPKETFNFFIQPLVPMVTIQGSWAMQSPLKPILKPGGHGMLWKAAIDSGIFEWFEKQQYHQTLIRQINNPMGGIDNGLLALAGIGYKQNKSFGFASCPRILNTAEGMNVIKKQQVTHDKHKEYEYSVTNIEYVNFASQGVQDCPISPGSQFSQFPSNTNILFADLQAVRKAAAICPIPGMMINMKTKVLCKGSAEAIEAGRLESLMQNIADYIVDRFPKEIKKEDYSKLQTFLTYNERQKTISVTKEAYAAGKQLLGTPEGCFFDLMKNYRTLLRSYCGMHLPEQESEQDYLEKGPAFLALFHPSLGPLWEVIAQKIRGGKLGQGSELIIEAAEVRIENLDLGGSLQIEAEAIMGQGNESGVTVYDETKIGRCFLKNVAIRNAGIDRSKHNIFWKMAVERLESVYIRLHGNAEFSAKDITLQGSYNFEVPDGHLLEVYEADGQICSTLKRIENPTWTWHYSFDQGDRVILKFKKT